MQVKYPRTYHHPLSKTIAADDKRLLSDASFIRKHVIVTEKMDGECTTLTSSSCHARSLDTGYHPSRTLVRALHGNIAYKIPPDMRICGENLQAMHSIKYDSLQAYFLVFNIWNGLECLSWKDTKAMAGELGLYTVPVLYEGIYDFQTIHRVFSALNLNNSEGIVIRNSDSFSTDTFKDNVCKIVRENHVATDEHWLAKPIVKNTLAA